MRLIDADELKTAFPYGEYIRTESVRATIDHMSTIEPERKKGKWVDGGMRGVYYCSECKHKIMTNVYVDQRPLWKYCPNCGSYNGGDTE